MRSACPFTDIGLDLGKIDQMKPDYLAINPNGVVPTRPCSQSVLSERGKSAQSSPFESHLRNPGSLNLAEMEE